MRAQILVLVASLLCLSQAYVSPINYYIFGDLRNNYVVPNSNSQQRGLYTMVYDGESKVLSYQIISNLQGVGAVELHGPASCKQPGGGFYDPTDVRCIQNTGPTLFTFGHGRAISTGAAAETTFQEFKGTVTLNSNQESMLFEGELYILIYSATLDDATKKTTETAFLRGNIGVYTLFYSSTNYPTYAYDNRYVFFTLSFTSNDGSFPTSAGATRSDSKSLGTGFLWFFLENGVPRQNQLSYKIFTTIETPGTYFLKCGSISINLNNNQNNPNPLDTTITVSAANTPVFLELLAKKQCHIFITSSIYPDGDLYSWLTVPSNMDAWLTGASESTPVTSPYFGRAGLYFDYGSKVLYYNTYHNITSQITSAFIEFDNGTMICNATGRLLSVQSCYINDTIVPFLEQGKVYFNIYTSANPSGELRGQVMFNGKSTASLGANYGLPSSTAIGLGVGLGIGIPLVIAIGVGIFCLVKRGGGSSKGI